MGAFLLSACSSLFDPPPAPTDIPYFPSKILQNTDQFFVVSSNADLQFASGRLLSLDKENLLVQLKHPSATLAPRLAKTIAIPSLTMDASYISNQNSIALLSSDKNELLILDAKTLKTKTQAILPYEGSGNYVEVKTQFDASQGFIFYKKRDIIQSIKISKNSVELGHYYHLNELLSLKEEELSVVQDAIVVQIAGQPYILATLQVVELEGEQLREFNKSKNALIQSFLKEEDSKYDYLLSLPAVTNPNKLRSLIVLFSAEKIAMGQNIVKTDVVLFDINAQIGAKRVQRLVVDPNDSERIYALSHTPELIFTLKLSTTKIAVEKFNSTCHYPVDIVAADSIYVLCVKDQTIEQYDLQLNLTNKSRKGRFPNSLSIDTANNFLYVNDFEAGTIYVYDISNGQLKYLTQLFAPAPLYKIGGNV